MPNTSHRTRPRLKRNLISRHSLSSQNERSRVNKKTKPTQLDRKTPKRRSKVVNKIHDLSPILEEDEEELFMQELEEERESQIQVD